MTAKTKTCPHCKAPKPTTAFGADKHRKDGLALWCRACMKAYRAGRKAPQPAPAPEPIPVRRHRAKPAPEPVTPVEPVAATA